MLIGVAHVPATFAFYADLHFWQIARGNMLRYAWTPLLLVVGTGLAFAMADALVQGFYLAGYWLWADMALRPAKHRCERFYIDWRNGKPAHPREKQLIKRQLSLVFWAFCRFSQWARFRFMGACAGCPV